MKSHHRKTEHNRKERLLMRVRDAFGWARLQHWTHAQTLDYLAAQIYTPPDWKRATAFTRLEVSTVVRCTFDEIFRREVDSLVLYTPDRLLYVATLGVPNGDWRNARFAGHFWKDSGNPPKPFTLSGDMPDNFSAEKAETLEGK